MIIRACVPLVRNLWIEQSKTRFAAETESDRFDPQLLGFTSAEQTACQST
jgi:hypothetical protein